MFVRITIMVMRLCVLIALILGILFWTRKVAAAGHILELHRGLGILVALSLVILAYFITTVKGRNIGLAVGAFVLAICMVALGFGQQQPILAGSSFHWIIQIVHLLLGLLAMGMGEMIAGRYKRLTSPPNGRNGIGPIQYRQ